MVDAGHGGTVRSLFNDFVTGASRSRGAGAPRQFQQQTQLPRARANAPDGYEEREERPTVAGNAIGQIVANRAMFQADAVDPPSSHPEVRLARRDREYLQELEGFVEPDNLGLIECVLCKYGVFNESTQNTAMGHFQAMFYMFCDRMHEAQMYAYMAQFWNADLRMEYPHVPPVTASGVTFHFKRCLRRRNMTLRLGDQMDRLDRALEVVEETGLYVEPDGGASDDDEAALPQQDREVLGVLSERIDAIRRYMEQPVSTGAPAEEGTVARRGLGIAAEERICTLMDEMASHVAGMTRRRRRARRRVALSADGVTMLQKLSATQAQTAKVMLEWRKYEDSEESAKTGLPTYCRKRKRTNETLVDIYSNKRVQAGGGPTSGGEADRAPGDLTDRFGAY